MSAKNVNSVLCFISCPCQRGSKCSSNMCKTCSSVYSIRFEVRALAAVDTREASM
uniref:Uncharacterized protein n=1 Tax=Arundo donax TaxID=35708 RepID=A0A0A8XZ26_ARUDO